MLEYYIFLCSFCVIFADTATIKIEIREDEIQQHGDWITILKCQLHVPMVGICSSFIWTHESDNGQVEPVMNGTELYWIDNNLDNYSSSVHILSSDAGEELYTCIATCDTRVYRINCWLGEVQNRERSSVCSERRYNTVIISATPTSPADENGNKKHADMKIGISLLCMLVVGMVLTILIRCRMKRQDALKHARVVWENANQCLLNTSTLPCDSTSTSRTTEASSDTSPIYRPISQRAIMTSRQQTHLERPIPTITSISFQTRLVLQEMADGSQLVFIPGSNLPSYDDSQNRTLGLMQTFHNPSALLTRSRNPFGSFSINENNTVQLSSPPSYASMVHLAVDNDSPLSESESSSDPSQSEHSSDTPASIGSSYDGLHTHSDSLDSEAATNLLDSNCAHS